MAKNRFTMQPQQTPPSMSPSYPHTVSVVASLPSAEDEDDNDICPVCDGECTCNNKARSIGPLSMTELSQQYATSASFPAPSTPTPTPTPLPKPSLKIKFTMPPNMLGKRRPFTKSNPKDLRNTKETTSVGVSGGEQTPPVYPVAGPSTLSKPSTPSSRTKYAPLPRKRGRPRKVVATTRGHSVDSTADIASLYQRSKSAILGRQKRTYVQKVPKSFKARGTIVKKSPAKRRRVVNGSSDSSDLSDVNNPYDPDDDDDTESVQFPTFLSASALSSMCSDSLSSLSDFDSDSSMEAEEETFIVSGIHEKARLKRELLGDGVQKGVQHNDWVIRPRKKSVSPSDAEMDVDTDATEDEDEEEEEEEGDDEEETDGRSTGAGYLGLVTGWSDDEESSFDADLFFANLSGSDSEGSSSEMNNYAVDDDNESQASTEAGLLHMREELENLPLELSESWDGQIVFTNGVHGSQGIIDIDFEVNASQFVAEASPSPCRSHDSDVDMSSSDVDDGGYEEDGGEGEGDTTDEELVGDDDLPNERAMRLFSLPPSVSSIDPMSTVSPAVSPGPRSRIPFSSINGTLESLRPADILAGRVFWDSDEHDDFEDRRSRSFSLPSSRSNGPRTGVFVPIQEARQAIIDDSHKGIPSPHPRFDRGRGKVNGRLSAVEALLRKHLATSRHSFSSIPGHVPHRLLPSVVIAGSNETDAEPLTKPIELDDVLEASFLHPDPSDHEHPADSTTADESDSHNDLKNLHRWDVISVGAFRHIRETGILDSPGAWSPDTRHTPASSADYGNVLKASPLSTMLWPPNDKSKKPKRALRALSPMIISSRGDGDRTPTNLSLDTDAPQGNHSHHDKYPHKTRKQLRHERKLKRKSYGTNAHNQHPSHHYHSHHHHPNSKARSSSSSQRSNFLSSVPVLNM